MINVIILAAGSGSRFSGYTNVSKPFIKVKGMTILEHCTTSIPFILHDFGSQRSDVNLIFAMHVRDQQHSPFIFKKYGKDCKIVWFEETTRGNLETALIASGWIDNDGPLAIFDCDNKFHCKDLEHIVNTCFQSVCGYFHDDPTDDKWANAILKTENGVHRLVEVQEKNINYAKYPRLIGIFTFAHVSYFTNMAKQLIKENKTSGNGEFYMTQSLVKNGFFNEITHFIPLGTPEDVQKFEAS